MNMRNSSKDILAKRTKSKRYGIYMTKRMMLLIIIEQKGSEVIITKYDEFCFNYVKYDLMSEKTCPVCH